MIRCGDMRWAVVKDGIACCTFGRRWYLPEMQGGSREPHAPPVVLPGERAVQVTVELVGPCSCQFARLFASHTCVLSLEEFKCLSNYLWCCAADGTAAQAREYKGLPEAPPLAF